MNYNNIKDNMNTGVCVTEHMRHVITYLYQQWGCSFYYESHVSHFFKESFKATLFLFVLLKYLILRSLKMSNNEHSRPQILQTKCRKILRSVSTCVYEFCCFIINICVFGSGQRVIQREREEKDGWRRRDPCGGQQDGWMAGSHAKDRKEGGREEKWEEVK